MNQEEELYALLQKMIRRYTSGDSTSVTYAKGQQLMGAILYCIREYEMGSKDLVKGRMSLEDAYDAGYQMLIEKVVRTREVYQEIQEEYRDFGLICYRETVQEGLPAYFTHYDARYYPQEHILTLDYLPLIDATQAGKVSGAETIYRYVQYLRLEQNLLREYTVEQVREILEDRYVDYTERIINLAGEVMRAILLERWRSIEIAEGMMDKLSEEGKREGLKESQVRDKIKTRLQLELKTYLQERWSGVELEYMIQYYTPVVGDVSVEISNPF